MVIIALAELPQLPFVVVAADFQQLNPVRGGGAMYSWVFDTGSFRHVELDTVYRTSDPELLDFLSRVREEQPPKRVLRDFFGDRVWRGSLRAAVAEGLEKTRENGSLFAWLCVTNPGADKVNAAALEALGLDDAEGRDLRDG